MGKEQKIDIKLGSEDMIFWRDIKDARQIDIQTAKNNLKYFEAIFELAKAEYKKAEEEFNAR